MSNVDFSLKLIKKMQRKEFTYRLVIDYCNRRGTRTFSLKEFYNDNEKAIAQYKPSNKHRYAKIRQQLQFLRDEGLITFLDNSGHYTLRSVPLLFGEVEDDRLIEIKAETPERREYLIETYIRDIGWVQAAKKTFGYYCLIPDCKNTFLKENYKPYIEVHHIIPLCEGGEEGIWNLAVVCAHHHRMAHFAQKSVKEELISILNKENEIRTNMSI